MTDYKMDCGIGHYEIAGQTAKGTLGATYTGREIDLGDESRIAQDWVDTYERSQERRPELEHKLLESLVPAPAGAFEAPLFRGRRLEQPPASSKCFGPPPPGEAKQGRYNAKGTPALYLCTSRNGVMRELEWPDERKQLWIRQFQFPVPTNFRIADARNFTRDSFSAAVFWFIEHGRERGSPPPQLGARLGEIIAGKFDGLIVPGVRGDSEALYRNVVVFRPEECWHELVDENAQPDAAP